MDNIYDLTVIGGGPGGYVAAIKAAKAGLSTCLIEKDRLGGTCLNRGCIPAKAMIHASETYRNALEAERFGINVTGASYDYSRILEYKQETIDTLVGGVDKLLKANGVTVIQGEGRLCRPEDGANVVVVDGTTMIRSSKVIIATGSKPSGLPVSGSDLPGVLNSDQLFALRDAPESLVIIGGGVIGVEFATVFSSLGSKVTIVEALPRILENFDKEISQNLKMVLKKRGVDIHTSASVQEILPSEDGLCCRFIEKDREEEISASYILCATGRSPATEGIFSDDVDAEMDGRFLKVDENFMTSIPGVYAIGDIAGGIMLAHAASAQGIRAVEHMAGLDHSQNIHVIPACVYTDPEIAQTGITEAQAKEEGIEVITGKFIMSSNGKSLVTREERGFIKVVADASQKKILGAQMMCARATDMIGEFTTAIALEMTVDDMLRGVRAHPTYNEGIGEALEDVLGGSIHTIPRR